MIIGKIGGKLIDGLVLREKEYEELKWLSGGRQQGKTYQLIKDQQKEIERLNNIITKLELYLINERINNWKVDEWTIMKIQNELEKLKEGK